VSLHQAARWADYEMDKKQAKGWKPDAEWLWFQMSYRYWTEEELFGAWSEYKVTARLKILVENNLLEARVVDDIKCGSVTEWRVAPNLFTEMTGTELLHVWGKTLPSDPVPLPSGLGTPPQSPGNPTPPTGEHTDSTDVTDVEIQHENSVEFPCEVPVPETTPPGKKVVAGFQPPKPFDRTVEDEDFREKQTLSAKLDSHPLCIWLEQTRQQMTSVKQGISEVTAKRLNHELDVAHPITNLVHTYFSAKWMWENDANYRAWLEGRLIGARSKAGKAISVSSAVGMAINFRAYLLWAHDNGHSVRMKIQVETEKKKKEEPIEYIDTGDFASD